MLKWIAIAGALCLAANAQAQEMRQFFAETATPLAEISANLAPILPEDVALTESADNVFVSYTGSRMPPGLATFLEAAFETLEPNAIAPGQAVSITLVMTELPERTNLSLMVMGEFAPRAGLLVEGGFVLMDGRGADPCSGQLIVQHTLAPDDTIDRYQTALEATGFLFEEPDEEDVSFFFGQGPDCAVALYVEGEAGGSTAIIRYLEE